MTLERRAVLKELKVEKNGILIEEIPFVEKLNLRGNAKDKNFLTDVGSILETLLPIDPNTKVENADFQVIWLSPNEWLINFNKNNKFSIIHQKLINQLNPEKTSVTDISENKTIIRIVGDKSIELLRKFMILDIDKILKDNSKVAQTIFVKIPILIIRNHSQDQKQSFDLHINRSHTNYLKELLLDGCNQFIN
jgi:sarcosine oxidase subunit gamma